MTNRNLRHPDWFEDLLPQPDALRLFCFPYAGGSSQVFRSWQQLLPRNISLCLVHLPGRALRLNETPFRQLRLLVKTLADVMIDELQAPFAFYGHSMGALIAFELARELRKRQSAGPLQLFLSGCSAPQMRRTDLRTFSLPDDEFVSHVRKLNGTPQELLHDDETRDLFLPALRADFEMVDTYQYIPEAPLSCPFTVYGGIQDVEVPAENLRAWRNLTSAACTVRMLPGDHFFVHRPEVHFVHVLGRDVWALLPIHASRFRF